MNIYRSSNNVIIIVEINIKSTIIIIIKKIINELLNLIDRVL